MRGYAAQIVTHGHVVNSHRAFLGVRIGQASTGVYIGEVTAGGPAAKAGIRVGDVITALDGRATPTADALGAALASRRPGETVTLRVVRQSGTRHDVRVKLGQLPGS